MAMLIETKSNSNRTNHLERLQNKTEKFELS